MSFGLSDRQEARSQLCRRDEFPEPALDHIIDDRDGIVSIFKNPDDGAEIADAWIRTSTDNAVARREML